MPRPKRKEIKLTHESAVALMQEIYNECVEQRTTAIRIQNKMISFMKEATDLTLLGPVLKEQQKIVDSSIEKKLQLAKLHSSLIDKRVPNSATIGSLSDDIRESISSLLTQDSDSNDKSDEYEV